MKRKKAGARKRKDDLANIRCKPAEKDRWHRAAAQIDDADSFSDWARKLLNAECDRLGIH
jgi:hypothetical protein